MKTRIRNKKDRKRYEWSVRFNAALKRNTLAKRVYRNGSIYKEPIPFAFLNGVQQRRKCMMMRKHVIDYRRDAYGDNFYSFVHHGFPQFDWDSGYVFSKTHPGWYYNVHIYSIRRQYLRMIKEEASKQIKDHLKEQGVSEWEYFRREEYFNEKAGFNCIRYVPIPIPCLDGKTLYEAIDEKQIELINTPETNGIKLKPKRIVNFDSAEGIDLDIVLDVPWLTDEIVNDAIQQFFDDKEGSYLKDPIPNPSVEDIKDYYDTIEKQRQEARKVQGLEEEKEDSDSNDYTLRYCIDKGYFD